MHFLVGLLRLFRIFGMLIGIRGKKWAVLTGSAKTNLSAAHAAYSAKRSLPSHRNDVPPSIDLNGSHLSRHHHLGAALLLDATGLYVTRTADIMPLARTVGVSGSR